MRSAMRSVTLGLLLVAATGCDAEEPLEDWKKTRHFERAVSDTSLSRMLEELSEKTISAIILSPDGPVDAIAYASFTEREANDLIRVGYAPYAQEISEFAHRRIAGALSPDDIDVLFAAGTDPEAIRAIMCAYDRPAIDGSVDWDGCTAQGFVALPERFRDAHARYSVAYQAVIDGPRTQTYYGGVSCRVLDWIQARLSNEKHFVEFDEAKLGISGRTSQDCTALKADLDALDRARNGA